MDELSAWNSGSWGSEKRATARQCTSALGNGGNPGDGGDLARKDHAQEVERDAPGRVGVAAARVEARSRPPADRPDHRRHEEQAQPDQAVSGPARDEVLGL